MVSDFDNSYLGGVNTNELLFNWHPILMVSGLIFCSLTAMLSYRILPCKKTSVKLAHAFFHTASIVCAILGVSAVFQCKPNILSSFCNYSSSNMYGNLLSKQQTILQAKILMAFIILILTPCIPFWDWVPWLATAPITWSAFAASCYTVGLAFLRKQNLNFCIATFSLALSPCSYQVK